MRRTRVAVIAALSLAGVLGGGAAHAAAADELSANGSCRDGVPHGAYELRAGDGTVRAIGAFNRGKRTGSFIFWNRQGRRVAHLPYDEDAIGGTVALWYPAAGAAGSGAQRREAAFSAGRRNGTLRAWYRDGRPSVEAEYRDGELVAAKAWDARGRALPDADARAAAARDVADDDAEFRAFEDLVRRHPPPGCAPPPAPRAGG